MTKRKPRYYKQNKLAEAIDNLPSPLYDRKHNLYIYIEGRARSNRSRVEHIIEIDHGLKVRDVANLEYDINHYFRYRKNPVYKNTFTYYILRRGKSKGMVKIAIRISEVDPTKAWIKTIYIAYKIK